MDNRFNKVFSSFDLLNSEFSPSPRIIDIFSSCFSFYSFSKYSKDNLISHSQQLDNLAIIFSKDLPYTLIVTDASIKNNMATSIAHIHICDKSIIKTLYHVVNITSIEAKLFSMRCGINQATNIQGISKIVVITDLFHTVQKIFDSLSHPFQLYSVSILNELRKFFIQNHNNSIKFWKYPSWCN